MFGVALCYRYLDGIHDPLRLTLLHHRGQALRRSSISEAVLDGLSAKVIRITRRVESHDESSSRTGCSTRSEHTNWSVHAD